MASPQEASETSLNDHLMMATRTLLLAIHAGTEYHGSKLTNRIIKNTFDMVIEDLQNFENHPDYSLVEILVPEEHGLIPAKQIINNLMDVVKHVEGVRLLLLSATPMYNNPNEIIWLLNLMMANDKRSLLSIKEVFDNEGNLLVDDDGNNIGERLLMQKLRGYVSFVRGENPYLFPYRIFPKLFSKDSIKNISYPKKTINNKEILQPIQYTDIQCVRIQKTQEDIYKKITEELKQKKTIKTEDKFGYTQLLKPLEVLNICYPTDNLTGIEGLRSLVNYEESKDPPQRFN